jgi:hypothetical protein
MFPLKESIAKAANMPQIPLPVDISKRKPKKFQLRIIIFDTTEVILDDRNFLTGELSSDIYVKAFMSHKSNDFQETDVDYILPKYALLDFLFKNSVFSFF